MSIHTIDRLTSPSESLRSGSRHIKTALADRALRRQIIQQTQHIEELHEKPVSATVTNGPELLQAIAAVREMAELTKVDEKIVADTAEFALDDSAEHLFEDLMEAEKQGGTKIVLGITAVLDALKAWDISRTEATHHLATAALDNFFGGARDNLTRAFRAASLSGAAFDDELDAVNQANR